MHFDAAHSPLLRLLAAENNAAMEADPPNADLPKRLRRRFQFRLRTLMIGITFLAVVCAYVGWQAKIVRDRQAWLIAHPRRDAMLTPFSYLATLASGRKESQPSFIRRWMGDVAQDSVELDAPASDEEQLRAVTLFPEARVFLIGH
jgi:hypothetical protein